MNHEQSTIILEMELGLISTNTAPVAGLLLETGSSPQVCKYSCYSPKYSYLSSLAVVVTIATVMVLVLFPAPQHIGQLAPLFGQRSHNAQTKKSQ